MKQRLFAGERDVQFRSLLGREPFSLDQVIVTPLQSIYARLVDGASLSEAKGFYQNARLRTFGKGTFDSGNGLIVCVPQGIQAQDILWVLPRCAVLFIGYAGSLSGVLEIGGIVEVVETLDEKGLVYPLETTKRYPGIRCGSSPCLLGVRAEECCQRGLAWGCCAVEMETAALAAAAEKNGQRLTAWLLITDAPGAVGFWEVDKPQRQAVNTAKRELVSAAVDWINGGISR